MKRYFATFYRHKWLYLSVWLLMTVASAAGAYYLSSSQYEVTARVWVDKPVLEQILGQESPVYGFTPSPAQQQADKLYQLVQTDSFVAAMIKGTIAADGLTGIPDEDREVIAAVRKKLAVGTLGANTMTITFYGRDPLLCQQVVQGTIDQFTTWSLQSQVEQSFVEVQFYQKQLEIYQQQVADVQKALDEFYTRYPNPDPASSQYVELQRLQRELESARGRYTAANSKIAQANLVDTLSDNNRRAEFQVMDKPTVPQLPSTSLMTIVKYFGLGVAASFGLVLGAILLATWQDTAIRTSDDLRRLTTVPLLALIPHVKPQPQHRRQAGAAAGADVLEAPGH